MSKRIDILRVLDALNIDYKVQGGLAWARCPGPDHRDSEPSWRVRIDEDHEKYGQHRCYGCGFGGYAVHLVEAVQGIDREAARAWLADYGKSAQQLPDEVVLQSEPITSAVQLCTPDRVILPHMVDPLAWPSVVRNYLISRGITPAQVKRWGIGYAADGYLMGRIYIPVYDAAGTLLSYTGRTFIDAEKRYKEPKLAEGADQGAVFGEQHWKTRSLIVAEGAFNALAVERALPRLQGRWDVGAIFGSQLTEGHLMRLSRFDRVLIASDGDKAGNRVALELEQALVRHVDCVGRVRFEDERDCNDLERHELVKLLQDAAEELDRRSAA